MNMRDLLNLFETAVPQWLFMEPRDVLQYINDWDQRPELGDGELPMENYTEEEIAQFQKKLRSMINDNKIVCYREMIIQPSRLDDFSTLGQCWTYDRRSAIAHNFSDGYRRPHGHNSHTLRAAIPISSVDWLATIALTSNQEHEIRVKPYSSIELIDIKDRFGYSVRTDLWGKTFKSS